MERFVYGTLSNSSWKAMDNPSLVTLGNHLKELRIARGWSLSKLAADAGIAKSNLSRLEQGNGNPTIDTIWRLAMQLDVPFGNLVAPISAPVEADGVSVRLIEQGKDSPKVDVYWMSCAANITHKSEAHALGTHESITVISGQIRVATETESQTICAGESYTFAADRLHEYQTFDQCATVILTVIYSKTDRTL